MQISAGSGKESRWSEEGPGEGRKLIQFWGYPSRYEAIASFPIPVQMLPGAELMKAVNITKINRNSLLGKLLASDKKALKVLE